MTGEPDDQETAMTGPAATEAAATEAPAGAFLIRDARDEDVAAIVGFEIDIAVVSFADEAITDPALHRRRVSGSLGKPGEITLVAVDGREPDVVLGWAWLSTRTNSLTGARYGNFRSLAVAEGPHRSLIGELLLGAVLEAADTGGLSQLTGKVHAGNLGMRALYRKFGFTATHLTMERRPGGAAAGTGPQSAPPAAGPGSAPPAAGPGSAPPAAGPGSAS
jgi:L-amino acid N-acyltransferase YncA